MIACIHHKATGPNDDCIGCLNCTKHNIVDERCRCGHLHTEHMNQIPGVPMGHGGCILCDCVKFTWKEFVHGN